MPKKVTFNGIELSLPNYDASALTLFDYLDGVIGRLENGLDNSDGSFQMSLNVDFEANQPPKHRIHANGATSQKTREKVASILKKNARQGQERVTGSVKVNLLVDDR